MVSPLLASLSIAASILPALGDFAGFCYGNRPYGLCCPTMYLKDYYSQLRGLYDACGYPKDLDLPSTLTGYECGENYDNDGDCGGGDYTSACAAFWDPQGCSLAAGIGAPWWEMGNIPAGWKEAYACVKEQADFTVIKDSVLSQDYISAEPGQCISTCIEGNYTLAALAAESVCTCGNEYINTPESVDPKTYCNRGCPGDLSTNCGGDGVRVFSVIEQ